MWPWPSTFDLKTYMPIYMFHTISGGLGMGERGSGCVGVGVWVGVYLCVCGGGVGGVGVGVGGVGGGGGVGVGVGGWGWGGGDFCCDLTMILYKYFPCVKNGVISFSGPLWHWHVTGSAHVIVKDADVVLMNRLQIISDPHDDLDAATASHIAQHTYWVIVKRAT